jgi:hypothetical protein
MSSGLYFRFIGYNIKIFRALKKYYAVAETGVAGLVFS